MRGLPFAKGQALGNDYIVVDAADVGGTFGGEQARLACDRHLGIGGDGVLLVDARPGAFAVRILNPDGTEAEKSGNGLRILAAWLYRRALVAHEPFEVRLPRDTVSMRIEAALPGGAVRVRVAMGTASFRGDAVGFRPHADPVLERPIDLPDGGHAVITTVSLSNPHCVVMVDRLEREDFLRRAPALCTHAAFTAGTNVQFARPAGERVIEAWIWERGAGETLASGSSACAVAAAAVRQGRVPAGPLEVRMQGGSAHVEVDASYRIQLVGPAQIVYQGEVAAEVMAVWRIEPAAAG